MKRFISGISAIVFTLTAINGSPLTPQQALERAMCNNPRRIKTERYDVAQNYTLQYSMDNAVYLFSDPGDGFMLVSGDDIAPAVLAYSDAGTFDADNMPPAMRQWIEFYAAQIREAKASSSVGQSKVRSPKEAIAPLITTKWNQSDPYNRLCPESSGVRCLTGCVATAVSQIMNYHEWPERGSGQIDYKTSSYGYPVNVDFSAIAFDWSNMADIYSNESSDAQCNAVAELMYAVGAAAEADYKSNETSAYFEKGARSLYTNFGYDKGLRILKGDYYTIADWEETVYNALYESGPVLFSGAPFSYQIESYIYGNSHAFVCDGYSDGYFHINFGWGGSFDGYYLLSAINPVENERGYSYLQSIVTGISKPREDSELFSFIVNKENFRVSSSKDSSTSGGGTIIFKGDFVNITYGTKYQGFFGVRLTGEDGSQTVFKDDKAISFPYNRSTSYITVNLPSTIKDGKYMIEPVYQFGEDWLLIRTSPQNIGKVLLEKRGGSFEFSKFDEKSYVRAENLELVSPLYTNCVFKVTATMKNNSDYPVSVRAIPVLCNTSGSIVGRCDPYFAQSVILAGGESESFSYYGELDPHESNPAPGDYTLYLANANAVGVHTILKDENRFSDGIPVTLKAKPKENIMTVTRFKVENEENVDPEKLELSWRATCNKGYYSGKFKAVVYAATGGYPIKEVQTDYIFLEQGKTENMTLEIPFPEAEAATRYWVALLDMNENDWATDRCYFTTADLQGSVSELTDDSSNVSLSVNDGIVNISGNDIRRIRIFDVAGMEKYHVAGNPEQIDISTLPAGIYIFEFDVATGIVIKKMVK